MAFGDTSIQYHKIWLADFFHGFPHLDLSFETINSTFDPESVKYREVFIELFLRALNLMNNIMVTIMCRAVLLIVLLVIASSDRGLSLGIMI